MRLLERETCYQLAAGVRQGHGHGLEQPLSSPPTPPFYFAPSAGASACSVCASGTFSNSTGLCRRPCPARAPALRDMWQCLAMRDPWWNDVTCVGDGAALVASQEVLGAVGRIWLSRHWCFRLSRVLVAVLLIVFRWADHRLIQPEPGLLRVLGTSEEQEKPFI